jgi:outer membrane lipoprotein-sorting protein
LVEKLIEKGTRDRELGPCVVKIIENEEVGGRTCRLIQVTHPTQEKGMDFHIAQIFFDSERMIPLRYAAFGWPPKEGEAPPLEEEYTYLNVQLNVGLSAEDFNPDNPKYQFP